MTQKDITHLRLLSQSIAHSTRRKSPLDVVTSLGAVQAQDYGQALWAIGARLRTGDVDDVLRALDVGEIVRTWPMRGTIHFVPAADAKWMVSLSAERIGSSAKARHEGLGIDTILLEKTKDIFQEALQGGKRLSRPTMMALLEAHNISTKEQRGYHILWALSLQGFLCIGPMEGKQQTYALLDEWVPHSRHLSREEGLIELARRYFISHGPATVQDFAKWSSQTLTDARFGLEAVKPHLVVESFEGAEYWFDRTIALANEDELRGIYLLPGFDEYFLGYKDREAIVDKKDMDKIVPGGNGIFLPMVVNDGRIVGSWRRKAGPKNIQVEFLAFNAFTGSQERQLRDAIDAYGRFMKMPIVVQ